MKRRQGRLATALAVMSLAGTVMPAAAMARMKEKDNKNAAIVLGAAAAYELLKKKPANGLALGAGAAYFVSQYNKTHHPNRRHRGFFGL